ncbi:dethiobiotin synthase [Aliifodinibius sp. S!AR15-10]|uniref:dethiobiotin synthase n=1 Tax=Aliifodinibius sp. S!AR15-10 TaxID=2950437 RepID=UPI00285B34A1|nr:dethiobiotin synthase [Aliifodinibius sp. S!AR15-10]MDR8392324.1 dethiobiotin synthase [Aliifodinibius sp. S!AR15-10]
MQHFPTSLFVTGTDTGIGKTVVSAMLTQALSATYWKPIQSGLEEETDTQFVKRVTELPDSQFVKERFQLTEPLSPHASAAIDGVEIKMNDFKLPEFDTENLIVEGAGGLMVPMNGKDMIIDLISYLDLPALLVSRSELGTLNHTFLSLEAMRERDIEILGVVMNGPKNESNRKAIEKYGNIDVLAEIPSMNELGPESLQECFDTEFC